MNLPPPDQAVSLVDQEREAGLTINERIALDEAGVRKVVTICTLILFGVTNTFVMLLVFLIFNSEVGLIRQTGSNYHSFQIVTKEVVMTLIWATAAQVGAVMLAISAYLFPRRS